MEFTQTITQQPAAFAGQKAVRVASIDLLRGLVMVIMALDHVRDYFHADAFLFDPTDLDKTTPLLFFTRWITHFCAPIFMFLSGTSAFLIGERKGKKALSLFLFTRGIWLIVLELTVVNFAWFFNPGFPVITFLVIWALGMSMVVLAALIWLPLPLVLTVSVVMIAGHNLLDGYDPSTFSWAILHKLQIFPGANRTIFVAYPLIPWIGVMALGYCTGKLYTKEFSPVKRKKWLLSMGIGAIALFVLLRFSNIYGDPSPWSAQARTGFSILSFLKTTKYPPSLLYLLMTLGPACVFLALTERQSGWLAEKLKTIGRVPMFYYLVHIYVIHLLAMLAASVTGFGWKSMVLDNWVSFTPALSGYGFSLPVVYLVWIAVVVALYFLCNWYDQYKRANAGKWWLSYL